MSIASRPLLNSSHSSSNHGKPDTLVGSSRTSGPELTSPLCPQLIAILGPPASGKNSLANYLQATENFIRVHINPSSPQTSPNADSLASATELTFQHSSDLLNHATRQWRRNFVTTDLREKDKLQEFVKRPFVAVLDVSAPVGVRWRRAVGR